MNMKKVEYVLYGLQDYKIIIEEIINVLCANEIEFDLKLILTEGLTNAYKHGNKGVDLLPIYLRYTFDGYEIIFEIEDSGVNSNYVIIPNDLMHGDILEGSGRGLFLISCYSDEAYIQGNKLILKKYFS
jgi:serine/threonine-protein kinase RsbW